MPFAPPSIHFDQAFTKIIDVAHEVAID